MTEDSIASELLRRFRVVDQMLTSHAILQWRNSNKALTVDIVILAFSLLLTLTALLDPAVLLDFGISSELTRIALAALSCGTFLLSLIQLRVDWKESFAQHRTACAALRTLKAGCRELIVKSGSGGSLTREEAMDWFKRMDVVLVGLPAIPERDFTALKASHVRKVELSRLLDRYPAAPVLLLRWKLFVRHSRAAIRHDLDQDE